MEWILQLHPFRPWMGEVLKTSQRACTVRACLGWKHHEAPWGECYNSTPSPHGWERYLKQARGPTQWELILVESTMKHHGVNITIQPPPPWMEEALKTCFAFMWLGNLDAIPVGTLVPGGFKRAGQGLGERPYCNTWSSRLGVGRWVYVPYHEWN